MIKLYGPDKREMMQVASLERDGSVLVVKGKIFGTMPMTAKVSPAEARSAFRLMDFRTLLFLMTLLFRRGPRER